MDEAERCHELAYISYGRLLTQGTVAEVIAGAGLVHLVECAARTCAAVAERLKAAEGVLMVAPFGARCT